MTKSAGLLALLLLSSGCVEEYYNSTLGQRGLIRFSFGFDDFSRPVGAGGALQGLQATPLAEGAKLVSSDERVMVVSKNSVSFPAWKLVTGEAGWADVVAVDSAGTEIDRATVTVAPVGEVRPNIFVLPVRLAVGGKVGFGSQRFGSDGEPLLGSGGLSYQLSDGLTGAPWSEFDYWGEVQAVSPGEKILRIVSHAAAREVPVDVVPLSAISSIQLCQGRRGSEVEVHAEARVDSGPVFGASCTWSFAEGSATVKEQFVHNALNGPARETTTLVLESPRVIATCRIGDATSEITIER
jgi:hypothetical protein